MFNFFVSEAAQQGLESFQADVNKLLIDIDRPINDDELSDCDEDELLVNQTRIGLITFDSHWYFSFQAGLDELVDEEPEENSQLDNNKSALKSNSDKNQTILSTLEQRRVMYVDAIKTANASNESSKARRYDRQLKVNSEDENLFSNQWEIYVLL